MDFLCQPPVPVCVWERVEEKGSRRVRGKADWHFSIMSRHRCKGGGNNFIGRAECRIHSVLEVKLTAPSWKSKHK